MKQGLEGGVPDFGLGDGQRVSKDLRGEFCPAMERREEVFEGEQERLAIALDGRI